MNTKYSFSQFSNKYDSHPPCRSFLHRSLPAYEMNARSNGIPIDNGMGGGFRLSSDVPSIKGNNVAAIQRIDAICMKIKKKV